MPFSRSRLACSSDGQSACWRTRMQRRCTRQPTAAEPAEVLAPVRARPDLGPVDRELEAVPLAHGGRREQSEVRKGPGEDEVVVPSVRREVAEHAESEDEGRQDAPSSVRVETHSRAGPDDPHTGNDSRLSLVPLPERQIGDLVPVCCEPSRPGSGRSARLRRRCTGRGSRRRCRSATWGETLPGRGVGHTPG